MKKTFSAFNLNVEKIGNIVSELHIHIIARRKQDISWPLSVWVVKKKNYSKQNLEKVIFKVRKSF
jgi:diadenosine tetraphosphate (Ap4A) HIT family hydrolase